MARMTQYAPGTPSWVDLGTPDLDAARHFYGELFGWSFEIGPPEAGGYTICTLDGTPVAGLGPQMNPNMPPFWATYISVADADASAARAAARGGTIVVEPMDVMDVGRMAVVTDPAGAVFSLWQPFSHIGAGIVNEPGTLTWNELTTPNADAAMTFYESVFDWKSVRHSEGGTTTYVEFQLDGRTIGGLLPMEAHALPAGVPPNWGVYFAVVNADDSTAQVTKLGGEVVAPPFDIPQGRMSVLRDPQGATFSIIALADAPG